jgi:hypothetical protein
MNKLIYIIGLMCVLGCGAGETESISEMPPECQEVGQLCSEGGTCNEQLKCIDCLDLKVGEIETIDLTCFAKQCVEKENSFELVPVQLKEGSSCRNEEGKLRECNDKGECVNPLK